MKPKTITFNITLEEANLIFKALGKLPFADVYELIGKLNEQANSQLKPDVEEDNTQDSLNKT